MCAEVDIYQIEELKKHLFENEITLDNKDFMSFGLLQEDWERLKLLENRIPAGSALKSKLLRTFRILIAALHQAHSASFAHPVEEELQSEKNGGTQVWSQKTTVGLEDLVFRERGKQSESFDLDSTTDNETRSDTSNEINKLVESKEKSYTDEKVEESSIVEPIVLESYTLANRPIVSMPTALQQSSGTLGIININNVMVTNDTNETERNSEKYVNYSFFPSTLDTPSLNNYSLKSSDNLDETPKVMSPISTRLGKYYISSTYNPTSIASVEEYKSPATKDSKLQLEQIQRFFTQMHSPKTGSSNNNAKLSSSSNLNTVFDNGAEVTDDYYPIILDKHIDGRKEEGTVPTISNFPKNSNLPIFSIPNKIPKRFKTSSNIKLVYSIEITASESWENSAPFDDKEGSGSANKDVYFPINITGDGLKNISNSNKGEITSHLDSKTAITESTLDNYSHGNNTTTSLLETGRLHSTITQLKDLSTGTNSTNDIYSHNSNTTTILPFSPKKSTIHPKTIHHSDSKTDITNSTDDNNYSHNNNITTRLPYGTEISLVNPETVQNTSSSNTATVISEASTLSTTKLVGLVEEIDDDNTKKAADHIPSNIFQFSTKITTSKKEYTTVTPKSVSVLLDGNDTVTTNQTEMVDEIILGRSNEDKLHQSRGNLSNLGTEEMQSSNVVFVFDLNKNEPNSPLQPFSSLEITENQNPMSKKTSTEVAYEEEVTTGQSKSSFNDNISFDLTPESLGNETQDKSSNDKGVAGETIPNKDDINANESIERSFKCPNNGYGKLEPIYDYIPIKPTYKDSVNIEDRINDIANPVDSFRTFSVNPPKILVDPPPTQTNEELTIFPVYTLDTLTSPLSRKGCENRNDCVMVKNIVYRSHKNPLLELTKKYADLDLNSEATKEERISSHLPSNSESLLWLAKSKNQKDIVIK